MERRRGEGVGKTTKGFSLFSVDICVESESLCQRCPTVDINLISSSFSFRVLAYVCHNTVLFASTTKARHEIVVKFGIQIQR